MREYGRVWLASDERRATSDETLADLFADEAPP
jgi:hypothetical protein